MTDRIRWGFLATAGWMAEMFAEGMSVVPDAEIAAVGSRALDTADAFRRPLRQSHGATARTPSSSPTPTSIIVYVSAAPNTVPPRATPSLALEAGKPVLCEKAVRPELRRGRRR